jgi:hypothetical protein
MIEKNKVDKIQSNLHLLDFAKTNDHIYFVSDPKEVKSHSARPVAKQIQLEDDEDYFEDVDSDHEEQKPGALSQKYLGEKERYIQ